MFGEESKHRLTAEAATEPVREPVLVVWIPNGLLDIIGQKVVQSKQRD